MTTRDSLAPVRLAVAALALLAVLATLFAAVVVIVYKPKNIGFGLIDVLVAPVLLVFYLGPGLLLVGMASRSRTCKAAILALVLAMLLSLMLELYRVTPWHFRHLRASPNDAETDLVIGTLFMFWPGTAVGGLLWLVLNRKPSPDPETR
jgi:predicted ferric reductase